MVRPYAGDNQVALSINPYHLGFVLWEKIIEEHGLAMARQIMQEDDDFGFIRNYLTEAIAEELNLFEYKSESNGRISVEGRDINRLRELILAPKFNFGSPRIYVDNLQSNGILVLRHDHRTDGLGLDMTRAGKVLDYLHALWRRPLLLYSINEHGDQQKLRVG